MSIEIRDLTKTYRHGIHALDRVTLDFGTGMIGLLGANGAGKTTLIRILTAVLRPTTGMVHVAGLDLSTAQGRSALKHKLGYLPQYLDIYPDLTGREFLNYIATLKGLTAKGARRTQVSELLEVLSLSEVADRRVGGYSGGMKRRLGIGQALLGNPEIIIVDEPTAGLDPEERMRFRSLLSTLGTGRTVILSTHILDDVAQTCPTVAVLKKGRVVYSGTTDGLVNAARGHTFILDTSGTAPIDSGVVVNAQAIPTGTRYRLVATRPAPGASPTEPTIEDGYVALMQLAVQEKPSLQD